MLQTGLEQVSLEEHRNKVNAVDFSEIKQNGDRKPEDLPMRPIRIGKAANLGLTPIKFQGGRGEVHTESCSLDSQKAGKEENEYAQPDLDQKAGKGGDRHA